MQKLQDLLPLSTKPDLPSIFFTLSWITREKFFTRFTTICVFTLYASVFINPDYFLSFWKIIQEKYYVKGTLAKVNSKKLVEN